MPLSEVFAIMMKNNIFSALSERSFVYAWCGEIFTLISTHIFNFFLILIVFDLTRSNIADAGIVLTITIPSIIFGMIAGSYVDLWNKRKVLLIVNLTRALLLVILAFYIDNLYFLFAVSFIFSFITQFFIPAELPILPLIVERKYLYSANALFGVAIYGSILIAYVLAGPLIIFLNPFGTLMFLSVSLLIASIFILFIRIRYSKIKEVENGIEDMNIFNDMKSTLALISHTKGILQAIFILALTQTLILVVAVIAPGYASTVLGIPIVQFPLLFVAPAALGTVVGAAIIINYFRKSNKNTLITIGIFFSAFSFVFLPFGSKVASKGFVQTINVYLPKFLEIDILHIIIVVAFILGLSNALVFVPANTLMQEKISEEFRGKAYGFLNTFVGVFSLLPIIIVGGLANLIGVGAVLTIIGVLLFFVGLLRFAVR